MPTTTYTILRAAGTRIPRPACRASSHDEMAELIASFVAGEMGLTRNERAGYVSRAALEPAEYLSLRNIDTDEPVLVTNCSKFYAYTEGKE